jgi:hypothetical protein
LERKVGQLSIELDFLKKNLGIKKKGEMLFSRHKKSQFLDHPRVPVVRNSTTQFLLHFFVEARERFGTDEADRRDLHQVSLLWLEKNQATLLREEACTFETRQKGNGANGHSCDCSIPEYIESKQGSPEISIFAQRYGNCTDQQSMEHGHNIHSATKRFCLSYSSTRLVQPNDFITTSLKQLRRIFLHRSIRKCSEMGNSYNIQHKSRSSVYITKLCDISF